MEYYIKGYSSEGTYEETHGPFCGSMTNVVIYAAHYLVDVYPIVKIKDRDNNTKFKIVNKDIVK
jgi:hypothetical protein